MMDDQLALFISLFLALEVVFLCLDKVLFRGGKVVFHTSFRSLVSRVRTSLAVAVGYGLSLPEAVVLYFDVTFCCRGEVCPVPAADEPSVVVSAVTVPTSPAPATVGIRRSGRTTRKPAWHKDYVM